MSGRLRHYLSLVLVAGVVFFTNLGTPPLWDRDEPRNAGCAAEMLQRGDWIVPVFNAELRTHKPVLLYWLMMCSYAVFGVGEFGARFWSALLGIGTVVLTYEIGSRLFDRRVAFWSGLILSTTVLFGVAVRAATPDSLLIFCGTLALAIFVDGAFGKCSTADSQVFSPTSLSRGRFPRSYLHVVAMYAAMGLGVLAKGPVGFVLPTAVVGMYLLIANLPKVDERCGWLPRLSAVVRTFAPLHFFKICWTMRPFTAVATVLVVALPWYVWVSIRTGGAWPRGFFWEHNIGRALQPMEGHSGPVVLFYVGVILIGFFPWSILAVPAGLRIAAAIRDRDAPRQHRAIVFLLCWVGVYVGLFSLAQTKLPNYVTPCYPALAVLVAYFVRRWTTAGDVSIPWIHVSCASLLCVGVGLCVGLPVAASRFLPGSQWLGLIGLVPVMGAAVCWRWLSQERQQLAAIGLASTSILFCLLLLGILPVEIGRRQRYYDPILQAQTGSDAVVAYAHLEPSWVFYGGRPIQYFASNEVDEMRQFVNQHWDPAIITTRERFDEVSTAFDGRYEIVATTPYFLKKKELVLLRSSGQLAFRHSAEANQPLSR